jgi:hypothetical protein
MSELEVAREQEVSAAPVGCGVGCGLALVFVAAAPLCGVAFALGGWQAVAVLSATTLCGVLLALGWGKLAARRLAVDPADARSKLFRMSVRRERITETDPVELLLGERGVYLVAPAGALLMFWVCTTPIALIIFFFSGVVWRGHVEIFLRYTSAPSAIVVYIYITLAVLGSIKSFVLRSHIEQEIRRVRDTAREAGELTLADSMGDDALVGALSADGAQGGELEQAGEGA